MFKDQPLVSVIMPVHNTRDFLANSIKSILSQSYRNLELLIYDDHSTDGSHEVIDTFAQNDDRIQVFRGNENVGAGRARNRLIEAAKGRLIAFCDSDDQWDAQKLEKQVEFMLENGLDLTYTSYRVVDQNLKVRRIVKAQKTMNTPKILRNNYIGCLTAIYDTMNLGKVYMPDIRKRQDWALWIDILKRTNKAKGLQEVLATYLERENSISSNKLNMIKYTWFIYYRHQQFSVLKSAFLLVLFLFYYFHKKLIGK